MDPIICCYRNNQLVFSIDPKKNVSMPDRALINLLPQGIRACVVGSPPDPFAEESKAQQEKGTDKDFPVNYYNRQFIGFPKENASEKEKEFFVKVLLIWAQRFSQKYGFTIQQRSPEKD